MTLELVIGWSTEYASQKFSIGVDDTDFQRIMAEQEIGEALAAKVSFFDKFTLLEATGRYLAEAESLRVIVGDAQREAANARATAARADVAASLEAIKAKLGLAAVPEAEDKGDEPGAGD